MPNIIEILFRLGGFQYAMSIGLNMRYYRTCISDNASNLFMIIISRVKFRYKRLPMVTANSPDISNRKLMIYFMDLSLSVRT